MNEADALSHIESKLQAKTTIELKLDQDPIKAAQSLFTDLRKLAKSGKDVILVKRKKNKNGSYWDAIWDRLNRAASLEIKSKLF